MKDEPITEKILSSMPLLKRNQLEELAGFHGSYCISIFLPTQRYGMEVLEGKDKIVYDNQLRSVRKELESYGLKPREIDRHLEPAFALLNDLYLWRNLSDGLAVFIGNDFFEYFVVPVSFEEYHHIDDHFYLKPLAPLFGSDANFFLLMLTLHGAQLFDCTAHSFTEVNIADLTPGRLEEVVGFDYEQRSQQWRSQPGGGGTGAVFHGQGRQDDRRKDEILQYCRAVNDGLMTLLNDHRAPLVVACVDYLFPIYREANHYKYLMEASIPGNPEEVDRTLMHEKAWEIVAPVFEESRLAKLRQYDQLAHTPRTSHQLEEIIVGAVDGRVDTLFLQNRTADVFGVFDRATNTIRIDEKRNLANASLLNLAVTQTLLKHGQVFLLDALEMPEEDTLVNALFRY